MVVVRDEAGADPQLAVGRQRGANARPVHGVRHVDVSRNLAAHRVSRAHQRLVVLHAHEDLVGGKLDADVVWVIVVAAQVQHNLQHLVSVVYTDTAIRMNAVADSKGGGRSPPPIGSLFSPKIRLFPCKRPIDLCVHLR